MKFFIATLGCPKNEVDSEMMAELLSQAGHEMVGDEDEADVLIVNTCGFIQPARDESLGVLGEMVKHKREDQKLVAAGCMAQRYADEIRDLVPGVDAVIGTRSWPEITTLLRRMERREPPYLIVQDEGNPVASVARWASMGATAYLKIADGCDASCAFCAIPLIKGRQRSKPVDEIVREAKELVEQGVQEIILIAQDTTSYGRDLGQRDALPGLLRAITTALPDLGWLRVMYAYPGHISPDLIETMASLPQMCRYIDLPLQHGHPDVLRRMNRPSDVDAVMRTIEALRDAMPDIALRSTFIVGYPGETEAEFQALLDFIAAIRFDKVGVFAYSAEDGTAAAELPDQLPAKVIAERYERAMLLQQEISLERNQEQVGRRLAVLIDGVGDGISVGRTYRDAPEIDGLVLIGQELPVGYFVQTEIIQAQEYDLIGIPIG